MAAPTPSAFTSISSNTSATLAVPVPTGVVSGTLVVVSFFGDWGAGISPTLLTGLTNGACSAPAGFNFATGMEFGASVGGVAMWTGFYYKYASGSDSGTYSFTGSTISSHSPTAESSAWACIISGGPSSGNPFVDTVQTASGSKTATVATFTPTANDSLLICATVNESGGTRTRPSGWTGGITGTSQFNCLDYNQQTTAAATGSLAFSSNQTDNATATVVTIRPPGGGGPTPTPDIVMAPRALQYRY